MQKKVKSLLFIALFLPVLQDASAQDAGVRDQLFAAADRALADAQRREAELLAPISYKKALENYQRADEDFKRGRKLEAIRRRLKEAEGYFARALEAIRLAEVTFSSSRGARNDAVSAGAARFSKDIWLKAERQFVEAATKLERGDVNGAKKRSAKAEALYRQAELEAIKANFLTPAWTLLEKADRLKVEKRAGRTLARARKHANEAEDLLRQNRYDNDEARDLAQKAKYEAKHALYLNAQIENIQSRGISLEDVFLAFERPFGKIARTVNVTPEFEKGMEPLVQSIIDRIADLQVKLNVAMETIEKRDSEIENLQRQIESMENRLGNLTEAERALKRKLERQRERESIITEVAHAFLRSEGLVLRSGENMIIRLYGLTFPVGRYTIEPQFFQLLTKVQNAIRKFPNCSVIVEGHTDSRGSDQANQVLSEQRAAAVRQYLLANMGLDSSKVASVGYGESQPITSNDTPEGRTQNRRIDIVIIPEWATN